MIQRIKLFAAALFLLAAAWIAPPVIQRLRHLCPVKPTGVPEAQATAAWARKYGVSCNVCHVAGYKLTRTGQQFLRSGHQMPGGEDKEANLSDYLALTAKLRSWQKNKNTETLATGAETKEIRNSFEAHALSIYAGGPLDKGFSFFSEMYLNENEKKNPLENAEKTESDMGDWARSKLAELYLQYNTGFGEDVSWTARMGRIMPWLIHLHGGGARLEYSRPLPFTSTVNSENPYRTFSRQFGASTGLSYKDAFLELGVVNGTGKYENTVEIGTDTHKDVFATLDYAFDGNGSMAGVYYYRGRYPSHWFVPSKYTGDDAFNQLGLMGNYTIDLQGVKGALVGSYLTGKNKFNTPGITGFEQKSKGYYIEAQSHLMAGDLAPYFRWDFFDADTSFKDNEKEGPVLGIHWKPMEHGRFVLEGSQYKSKNASKSLTTGAVTAATKQTTERETTLEIQFMF
ncbi:MAG: hypothetical protein HYT79_03390 [Elusimicrobia bacterium]|nr:hypothetical protein [Elusimicrobiota bacterium]